MKRAFMAGFLAVLLCALLLIVEARTQAVPQEEPEPVFTPTVATALPYIDILEPVAAHEVCALIPVQPILLPLVADEDPEIYDTPARAPQYIFIEMTEDEYEELARVVYLEAGNQSADGQQAVVEVVFNRVLHSAFPNTVHDVLHDPGQFSTIGAVGTVPAEKAISEAIDAALFGDTILDRDVVFFSRAGENNRVWGTIGDHVFCREYIWG